MTITDAQVEAAARAIADFCGRPCRAWKAADERERDEYRRWARVVLAAAERAAWQTIETAPEDKDVLLWWRPRTDNPYAESVVLGQISSHETGKWWNGQRGEYQDIWHVTHWRHIPSPPEQG